MLLLEVIILIINRFCIPVLKFDDESNGIIGRIFHSLGILKDVFIAFIVGSATMRAYIPIISQDSRCHSFLSFKKIFSEYCNQPRITFSKNFSIRKCYSKNSAFNSSYFDIILYAINNIMRHVMF